MKTQIKKYFRFWNELGIVKSLLSTAIYCLLLLIVVLSSERDTLEWLYLEVYNITLFYIILNMLFFVKDIINPITNSIFSKQLIQVLSTLVSAILVILALFLLKNAENNALATSQTVIKINIALLTGLSFYFSVKMPSEFFFSSKKNNKKDLYP